MKKIETIYVIAAEIECPNCHTRFRDVVGELRGATIFAPCCQEELVVDSECEFEFEIDR